jgi:hypothetical protein
MRHMLCGARNRDGSECRAFPVRSSRRCKWHGGMSTGPVTLAGKLRCYEAGIGAWLAAGNRPHRGPNVIAIDQPLDRSTRAQMRSPAWQKCLVLRPEITGTYDRVVWLDADILINPDAPAITNGVPIEKIGAVDESVFPTVEENRAYWNWTASENRDSASTLELCRAAMDARDWHAFWGLPRRGDHIVQTGVLVLSPSHHRDLLEYVYDRYEDKGAARFDYEMRPLSFEIQEHKLVDRRSIQCSLYHPADPRAHEDADPVPDFSWKLHRSRGRAG